MNVSRTRRRPKRMNEYVSYIGGDHSGFSYNERCQCHLAKQGRNGLNLEKEGAHANAMRPSCPICPRARPSPLITVTPLGSAAAAAARKIGGMHGGARLAGRSGSCTAHLTTPSLSLAFPFPSCPCRHYHVRLPPPLCLPPLHAKGKAVGASNPPAVAAWLLLLRRVLPRSGNNKLASWEDGQRDQELLEHAAEAAATRRPPAVPARHRAGDRRCSRAQNPNPFPDADNASTSFPAPLLFDASNPFAPPPLINQNYPLLNQMQGMHFANNQQPVVNPVFHQVGGFGSGLPPLPTNRVQHELPSNQIDTGLLESLLLGDAHHHLPRANPGMFRVGSMPELMNRDPSSGILVHGGGGAISDSDVTSRCRSALHQQKRTTCTTAGNGTSSRDQHTRFSHVVALGNWCIAEDVKPAKRRAASEVKLDVSHMFGTNNNPVPPEWFGGSSTAPSPGSASAVTDDEFNLEMQQFMSLLPLSLDEHNWNAQI
ncbi:hypothetical protein PR202_gb28217 [Eleusine coracana subsp. coracana]|uniref:Uncharacterized protein n=1 Tax=Eleusine coracana subsp. coracana TaxID=191504 RepID=A0AAV5FTV0_ELECO|nr:hypothetical protein PR202_gb28217 [Eleusine coracana subsp. coracana]